MDIKILNLYSNVAMPGTELVGEHGQSFLLKMGNEDILFDAGGSGSVLLKNMDLLNVNPDDISKIILSHGHYDHTLGLPDLLDARKRDERLPIYAHPAVREKKYGKILFLKKDIGFPELTKEQEEKIDFKYSRDPIKINKALWTTGEIQDRSYPDGTEKTAVHKEGDELVLDPIYDDLSLILETNEGQVIITGCAHAGILNICAKAKKISDKPIKAIIGGTHMARYSEAEVLETAEMFKKEFDDPNLYLNHCTDRLPYKFMKRTKALDILQSKFGEEKIRPCYVGTEMRYTATP